MSAISASDHASSSYTDYNAFVMLDHVHFILYTLLEDSHKLYLDLNIGGYKLYLGWLSIYQRGYLHRDISIGNVMAITPISDGEKKR